MRYGLQDPRTAYQRLIQDHLYRESGEPTEVDVFEFLRSCGQSEMLAKLGTEMVKRTFLAAHDPPRGTQVPEVVVKS